MSRLSHLPRHQFVPDFRNLGVMLRILVGVNLGLFIGALIAAHEAQEWQERLIDASVLVEPGLLGWLGVMWLLSPMLARLPVWRVYLWIACSAVCCACGVRYLLSPIVGPLDEFGWWRLIGLTLVLVIGGLTYFNSRVRALAPAIIEARLQALQARIRPHFLFNSLNAVLSLIRTDPAKAERALEDMADLFRVFMRENRELSTLQREVDLAWQYLELERLRLGERLQVEWNIDKMPDGALIPPLVLQPLLENAVYHGIEPSSQPGQVRIDIYRRGDLLNLVVKNPWKAEYEGRHAKGTRMAMGNIRERLALHYDAEASIRARVNSDSYTVHVVMPYREKENVHEITDRR